ncbi:MAG TPA: hypothetical protein VED41_11520, partial [Solirubrobacteraceae bacterium]|nr:hypothetical protein [Solirubrobacteraceae bacterium]
DGLDPQALRAAFARAHEQRYGYRDEDADIELVNMRASVWGRAPTLRLRGAPGAGAQAGEVREVIFGGRALPSSVLRGELAAGTRVDGPALCAMPESTLLVPPQWSGTVDEYGTIHLRRD